MSEVRSHRGMSEAELYRSLMSEVGTHRSCMSEVGSHRSCMSEVGSHRGMSEVGELTAILPEPLGALLHYFHHISTPHGKRVRALLLITHHHRVFTRSLRMAKEQS